MDICAYDRRGCVSFSEAVDRFENPHLANDEYNRLASYGSVESNWWAEQKLRDIANQNRLAELCQELGDRASKICALHEGPSDIYVQPKTVQIYRTEQPASALMAGITSSPLNNTIVMTQQNIVELSKQPELSAITAQEDASLGRPQQVA